MGTATPLDEFDVRILSDIIQPPYLLRRRSNVPTILGFQQGNEEEAMVPIA
jgi:hypothetical protein